MQTPQKTFTSNLPWPILKLQCSWYSATNSMSTGVPFILVKILIGRQQIYTTGRFVSDYILPWSRLVDLGYDQTNNMEYWDPEALITVDGALEVTLREKDTHGLPYEGGMMSTWNKFCFTGGLVETSVTLPGSNSIAGLWPAIWALGNLGRTDNC